MMIYKYSLSSLFLFFSPSSFPPFFLLFFFFTPVLPSPQHGKIASGGDILALWAYFTSCHGFFTGIFTFCHGYIYILSRVQNGY